MKSWATLLLSLLTFALFPLPTPCADPSANSQKTRQRSRPEAKTAARVSSLTGCIDERDAGHYVLVDETKLGLIAELETDGFPKEGFAKHLGHKVTVQGNRIAEAGRAVFRVRKLELVSETCAPPPPSQ